MNRERILFVAVVAILGLWFLLRSPQAPVEDAKSKVKPIERVPAPSSAYTLYLI